MDPSPRQENRHLLWFIGVASSFASFLYYPLTYHLTSPSASVLYLNPPVERLDRIAALLNLLLLGGVGGVVLFWTEISAPRLLRKAIRILFLFFVIFLAVEIGFPRPLKWRLAALVTELRLAVLVIVITSISILITSILLRYESKIFPLVFRVLLFFVSFAALTIVSLLTKLPTSSPTNTPVENELPSPVRSNNPNGTHHVLWLVFDELDRTLAFPSEEAPSPYPSLEALRSQSVAFSAASSPSNNTDASLPALTTGLPVQTTRPLTSSDLELTLEDGTKTTWHHLSSVFHDARQRGMKTILVGWHHPYSRIFLSVLDECWWESSFSVPFGKEGSLLVRQGEQLKWIWLPVLGRPRLSVTRYRHLFDKVLFHLREDFAANRDVLMLAHLPIPHPPSIYDAERQQYSFWPRSKKESYRHNMALLDKAVGEIRKTLEENGTWEHTLVIFSADHGIEDPALGHRTTRVPFLVKLPRQRKGHKVTFPVNTVMTRELIKTVLDGTVQTPEDLEAWAKSYSVRRASTGVSRAARRAG